MTASREAVYRCLRWVFWLGFVAAWGAVVIAGLQHEAKRIAIIAGLVCSIGGLIVITLQMLLPPKREDGQ